MTLQDLKNYPQEREMIDAEDFCDETVRIQENLQELSVLEVKLNNDNTFTGSNTFIDLITQGKRIKAVASVTGAGAIPLTSEIVKLTTTGANALTLADGADGQELTIMMISDGGDGVLTPVHFGNGTTITFNDVGDSITLIFTNSKWYIKSNLGCIVA